MEGARWLLGKFQGAKSTVDKLLSSDITTEVDAAFKAQDAIAADAAAVGDSPAADAIIGEQAGMRDE